MAGLLKGSGMIGAAGGKVAPGEIEVTLEVKRFCKGQGILKGLGQGQQAVQNRLFRLQGIEHIQHPSQPKICGNALTLLPGKRTRRLEVLSSHLDTPCRHRYLALQQYKSVLVLRRIIDRAALPKKFQGFLIPIASHFRRNRLQEGIRCLQRTRTVKMACLQHRLYIVIQPGQAEMQTIALYLGNPFVDALQDQVMHKTVAPLF